MKRVAQALAIAAIVLIPSFLFLGRYMVSGTGIAPVGSDTPQHVWRSEVVAQLGLQALTPSETDAHALQTNADRPGLPLVLAALSTFTGADARDLAYVLPGVVAAAIAAAAAAVAGAIPKVPWWGIALAGLATGTSVQVALAANGYLDQLVCEALVLGAAAGALRAATGGSGRTLGAGCLAAALLVHWQFAAIFSCLLGLLALACLPESVARGREGGPFLDTPTGRLGVLVGAGSMIGFAVLLVGAPGPPRGPIALGRGASADRGQARLYRLPAMVVAAAVGAVSLLVPRGDPGRRRAAWLLIPWALLPAVAALLYAVGRTIPVQRSLSFALAIPLLAALGAVRAIGWLHDRAGRLAAAVAAMVIAAALVASISFGWEVWLSRRPWSEDGRLASFRAVATYVANAGRPAVIVVDAVPREGGRAHGDFGTVPVLRRVRAELPPDLALRTTVYLGDPDRLADDLPTLRPGVPGYNEISRATWGAVRLLLSRDPVIVVVRSHFNGFRAAVKEHPEWKTTPSMAVVSGPPPSPEHAVPPERPSSASLAMLWAASLAVITLAGAGWAARFGEGSFGLRMALAPTTGLAVIVVAGVLAERLGVRMGGPGGLMTVIILTLGGTFVAIKPSLTRSPPR